METQFALQAYRITPEVLKSPLPFDLYNDKGLLLIKKGKQIKEGSEILLSQPLYRLRDNLDNDDRLSLQRFETLYQRYGKLIGAWGCRSEDVLEIKRQVSDLVHLCGSHSDLCVATASHLPGKSHATKQCFATAIVAILIGDALGWNLRRQHVLARAALTMNLSLLSLHDDWAKSRAQLSETHKGSVSKHPGLSAELLIQSPGVDFAWITAVDQHHENMDGSGYPIGLEGSGISPEARVLRVADAWCALILSRSGKARKTPKDAIQEMSKFVGNHFDHQVFQALKKLMGAYPPGTFVRLANRETAIIMRWDKQGSAPRYATSVLSPTGEMPSEFKVRPLTRHGYEIRDYTYLDMSQMARFSVSRIWATGTA
jgi:HD-GYP domain-containing protein (c-di-GMP phosphodiesterase class II)